VVDSCGPVPVVFTTTPPSLHRLPQGTLNWEDLCHILVPNVVDQVYLFAELGEHFFLGGPLGNQGGPEWLELVVFVILSDGNGVVIFVIVMFDGGGPDKSFPPDNQKSAEYLDSSARCCLLFASGSPQVPRSVG